MTVTLTESLEAALVLLKDVAEAPALAGNQQWRDQLIAYLNGAGVVFAPYAGTYRHFGTWPTPDPEARR